MDLAEAVIGGIAGGGAAAARFEVARLLRGAVTALTNRGSVAKELSLVLDAVARSDTDLAAEYNRLPEEVHAAAQVQLREVLADSGHEELSTDARRIVETMQAAVNRGQIISHSGPGDIHAPFHVHRDYRVEGH